MDKERPDEAIACRAVSDALLLQNQPRPFIVVTASGYRT